jgi:Ca2+-binding EF-hand superfamily protein
MHRSFMLGTAALALSLISANHAQAQMRFEGMDRNNDGVITRSEWRGNDQSFRNQDWNGDGVLSGDEVRPGARRQTGWNQDWNHDGIINQQDTLIAQQFRRYDNNGDNRVSSNEWQGNQRLFARLDTNRDGYLTMAEYTNNGGFRMDAQGGPSFSFGNLDRNRDGWIARNEWPMSSAEFSRLDANRDNRISSYEFRNEGNEETQNSEGFWSVDRNRDGWITRSESGMSYAEFNRLDVNNDNRLSRFEFENTRNWTTTEAGRSAAFRMGWDRGIAEGRNAGREDRANNHGWDLEGQTELERADSGYSSQMGSLSDYQEGYREAFRLAYREGYNSR